MIVRSCEDRRWSSCCGIVLLTKRRSVHMGAVISSSISRFSFYCQLMKFGYPVSSPIFSYPRNYWVILVSSYLLKIQSYETNPSIFTTSHSSYNTVGNLIGVTCSQLLSLGMFPAGNGPASHDSTGAYYRDQPSPRR